MMQPLPFSLLLDVLRAKGLPLGVRDYIAWTAVVERIERSSGADRTTTELKFAAMALLARSPQEAAVVEQTFDEVFLREPPPVRAAVDGRGTRSRVANWLARPTAVWTLLALLFVTVAAGAWLLTQLSTTALPAVATPVPRLAEPFRPPAIRPSAQAAGQPPSATPPARPELPAAPRFTNPWSALAAATLVLVLVLSAAQRPRARAAHRRWVTASWRRARAQLPGPSWFTLRPRHAPRWFDRRDIEDAATVLARAFTTGLASANLDARRTVIETVRRGAFPRLVFRPSTASGVLLLLQDVGEEMHVWTPKVEALVSAFTRQGIALERYFFEDSPARVSAAPFGETVPFERLRRVHANGLLIVSSGRGVPVDVERDEGSWMKQLNYWSRRSWLNPVIEQSRWRPELQRLPLTIWPLVGEGIMAAAHDLAAAVGLATEHRARLRVAGRAVLRDDVERLKRLVALASHPSIELVESLRQRFVPDVPEDTVLHVLRESQSTSPDEVRLPAEDVRRLAAAERRENADREKLVRSHVLQLLRDSEPPVGSVAHLRWELATAAQELALAEAGLGSAEAPRERLRALANGPLWAEVGEAVHELRDVGHMDLVFPELKGTVTTTSVPAPSTLPSTGETAPRSWAWLRPQARDVALAMTVAGLVALGLQGVGAFEGAPVDHVENAYRLQFVPGTGLGRTAGVLRISRGADAAASAVPDRLQLMRGSQILPETVVLPPTGPAERPVTLEESGAYFQARATLGAGNLALSNPILVPPMNPVVPTVIDAAPWATVRILDPGSQLTAVPGEFTTPFVINLQPGAYTLELRHPDFGLSNEPIEVRAEGENRFRVALPGFDAERALQDILGNTTASQPPPARPSPSLAR